MRIHIAADHAGWKLKEHLTVRLREKGHIVEDHGAHVFDPDDDYPPVVAHAAHAVAHEPDSRGIIIGGSGQGEAVMANRFPGVRAVVWYGGPPSILALSREHNDANILSIGARFVEPDAAWIAVEAWLATAFSGHERHLRRIKQLDHALD